MDTSEQPEARKRRPLQFGLRTLLEVTAVAAFILALMYNRQERGDGRYQLSHSSQGSAMFMLDTKTGELWRSASNSTPSNIRWTQMPTIPPAQPPGTPVVTTPPAPPYRGPTPTPYDPTLFEPPIVGQPRK